MDKPAFEENIPVVKLQKLSAYILVKLGRTRAMQLERLGEPVISIFLKKQTFGITLPLGAGGKIITRTVHHTQYPMSATVTYAFTDYQSQGRAVLVDSTSCRKRTLVNLHVAVRLLRWQNTRRRSQPSATCGG